MILALNIILSIVAVVGIVSLLAYNIYPLRRPLRLDDTSVVPTGTTDRRDATPRTNPYAARRGHQPGPRSLDGARA